MENLIIQPPHLWASKMPLYSTFSGSLLPAKGSSPLFCLWFRGAQILTAVARLPRPWAPFPSALTSRSLGALELGSAPAWALWTPAREGTAGSSQKIPASHLRNHLCISAETSTRPQKIFHALSKPGQSGSGGGREWLTDCK